MRSNYWLIIDWGLASEYAAMRTTGTVFQPELIELMRAVLDDATAMLPEAKRTSSMKAEIASHILESAANGERDPIALRATALSAIVECSHYSHDINPARRAV
jgi:predicted subunit of tRNA(5-methylaminomethyl-2-thiouridylate) methyltransferase